MRNKTIFIVVSLVLAVLLGACVQAAPATTQQPRTISVNGTAQVSLTPDIAYISVGVNSEAATAAEAVSANNTQSQAITDALIGMGIDAKDIRTTNFSIYPQEKWSPDGMEKLGTVFVVNNTVYVTIRNIDRVGAVLDAVVQAGANNVYGISFDVEDKEAALLEARGKAVENARTQAEQLAQAAGIELGSVYSISYYNSYPSPVYDYRAVAESAYGGGSVPISAGELTITVDVNLVYEIK